MRGEANPATAVGDDDQEGVHSVDLLARPLTSREESERSWPTHDDAAYSRLLPVDGSFSDYTETQHTRERSPPLPILQPFPTLPPRPANPPPLPINGLCPIDHQVQADCTTGVASLASTYYNPNKLCHLLKIVAGFSFDVAHKRKDRVLLHDTSGSELRPPQEQPDFKLYQ